VINLITGTLPGLLLTLLKLTAITALCIWLNWKATLLIFSAMPLFYFLNHYFGKKSFHMNKALNERGQVLSKTLQDTLSRIKLYKAFYRERKGLRQYKGETITQMRVLIKNFWLGIMNANSHQVLNTGFGLVLTIYLGLQVLNGKMTLGSYVALSIYLAQLAGILKSLGGAYQGLVSQFVYVDRFFEIYEHGPVGRSFPIKKLPAKASDNKRAVVFDEVTFGYHPENAVLKNITFGLRPGEAAAIIGNSGTGKSTLAHLMLGLYTPSGGRILIHDQDITLTGEDFIRKTVGIVLQDTPLLNTSIKENVTFATTKVSDEEFQQAVRIAEVDSFVNMKKEGYELLIGEQGASLSQGQRQRIAIAMALIKSPAVLILDEATNQLDQGMEARIIRNIRTRLPQTTLVIISCRTNALQLVDTVFELRDGNLMYRGSPCNRTLAAHV
jgi:ABC-type bacteriocin/lantibiotic exporter with double-glycine peptidase domain